MKHDQAVFHWSLSAPSSSSCLLAPHHTSSVMFSLRFPDITPKLSNVHKQHPSPSYSCLQRYQNMAILITLHMLPRWNMCSCRLERNRRHNFMVSSTFIFSRHLECWGWGVHKIASELLLCGLYGIKLLRNKIYRSSHLNSYTVNSRQRVWVNYEELEVNNVQDMMSILSIVFEEWD